MARAKIIGKKYAQNRTVARSFLARNGPSFHGPPRSLRRVVAANCCEMSHEANFVSYAWRGATPSVPFIPARWLEPWMKHVSKPWEEWDIYCHHGRTLGSAGKNRGLTGKIIYKWIICHCHVWLPEGGSLDWWRWRERNVGNQSYKPTGDGLWYMGLASLPHYPPVN